ncbi:MAG: FIST N-terminal domain-containing protein [Campylobacterota bacterium]|nr:FIST N-terminal domain-containing protein [Campylobacterota bacterium]
MKHLVFKESDKKSLSDAIKEAKKSCYKSVLLQIFSSQTDKKKLTKIIKKASKNFPNAIIIGATTAGEISHAKMYDKTTIYSLTLFKKTTLKADYVDKTDNDSAVELSSKILNKHTKAIIILSEGLFGEDYDAFINGFKEEKSDIIVAGGLAGDNFKLKKTFVFLNGLVYDKGSVAVSLSSEKLYADNRYNLNWTPIGKEFTITKVEGNVVHEIDNQSSVSLFKKYLGSHIFDNNAKYLPDFQFLFKEGLTTVARTPMARDADSLIFAAPLKEGQKVQFGFSNASSVISGSNLIKNIINKKPADAIYIFSCIARKTLLGERLEDELKNFESIAPSAGFFTYGEYYSTGSNNALLNCTTTVLVLSESKKIKKNKKVSKKSIHNIDDITFNSLTHFIEQTSQELNTNVKLLSQYKDAVDASLLVSKTDTKGLITFVNDNFCRVSGYSREELIGKNHNIVRDRRVSNFIFKKMWATIKSGKIWRGQFPNKAKNGTVYYVDATIMPTYNESNNIDGYIAVRQDVTKQIIAKNRIREKEKFIKAIFDNQDNIVILCSKDKGMISANKTLFDYFDYVSFEELKANNKCICDLFMKEDGYIYPDEDGCWLDEIMQNHDLDCKAKILAKNNQIYIFDVKVNKIDNQYIVNLSDITNLENALQKAYSSEKAKSIFLANMSHEIRTPLNGILGFTDLLKKKNLDKESNKYIDIIHNSGTSLLNIVNDILDFSKIENGDMSLYKVESNLFSELESVIAIFSSTAKMKKIDYFAYIDTNIPKKVKCDIQRIKQVLSNLLSNAIKFTPQRGSVDIKISLKEIKDDLATIEFIIKDSGIGISKDKIKTIFDAFSQADNSISKEFGGTGLGLSISSQYVEMMGDELKVKSIEGEGSEFYFNLNLPILDIQNKKKVIQALEVKELEKFYGDILIAEDNTTNQILIGVMLEERGLNYTIVENGQEAIYEALKNRYDIIFMDINMPVLDGVSATKELRKRGYERAIISLSANVIKSDVKSYKEAGMDESLAKPIISDELDSVLRKYITTDIDSNIETNMEKEVKQEIDFDDVDVDSLAKAISIPNTNIIMKLLVSFSKSAEDIISSLDDKELDDKILHNIKGISGNLRFNKLYELSKGLEYDVDNWDESQKLGNKELIIAHLRNIIDKIALLNK